MIIYTLSLLTRGIDREYTIGQKWDIAIGGMYLYTIIIMISSAMHAKGIYTRSDEARQSMPQHYVPGGGCLIQGMFMRIGSILEPENR